MNNNNSNKDNIDVLFRQNIFKNKVISRQIWFNVNHLNLHSILNNEIKNQQLNFNTCLLSKSKKYNNINSLASMFKFKQFELLRLKLKSKSSSTLEISPNEGINLQLSKRLVNDEELMDLVYPIIKKHIISSRNVLSSHIERVARYNNFKLLKELVTIFLSQYGNCLYKTLEVVARTGRLDYLQPLFDQIQPSTNISALGDTLAAALLSLDLPTIKYVYNIIESNLNTTSNSNTSIFKSIFSKANTSKPLIIRKPDVDLLFDKIVNMNNESITTNLLETLDFILSRSPNRNNNNNSNFEVYQKWSNITEGIAVKSQYRNYVIALLMFSDSSVRSERLIIPLIELNDSNLNTYLKNNTFKTILYSSAIRLKETCYLDILVAGDEKAKSISSKKQPITDIESVRDTISSTSRYDVLNNMYKYIYPNQILYIDGVKRAIQQKDMTLYEFYMKNLPTIEDIIDVLLDSYSIEFINLALQKETQLTFEVIYFRIGDCYMARAISLHFKELYTNYFSKLISLESNKKQWDSILLHVIKAASYCGFTHTLQFIHENLVAPNISIIFAVNSGQYDTINYLSDTRMGVFDEETWRIVGTHCSMHVFKRLYNAQLKNIDVQSNKDAMVNIMTMSYILGRVDFIKMCEVGKHKFNIPFNVLTKVLDNGHVEAMQYFIDHYSGTNKIDLMLRLKEYAVMMNNQKMLKLFKVHRPRSSSG